MNKFYKLILSVFFVSLLFPISGFATHIVGGSITYEVGAGNTYTITLKMYRDCGSAVAFPGSPAIEIRRGDGANYSPSTVTLSTISTTTLAATLPPCASAPGTPPCVEERIYRGTVVLAPSPAGIHLFYQLCCRNGSITNITSPGAAGESFYAFIPGYQREWVEGFSGLADGLTSDAGATKWTGSLGPHPATSAQTLNEQFEIRGADSLHIWNENFTLADGTTNDAGPTAWSITQGSIPTTSASVQGNQFEVAGSNSATVTWTSGVINISTYTTGVSLRVTASRSNGGAGNLEAGDSLKIYYSLNSGPLTLFTTNGQLLGNFTNPSTASSDGLIGNTIQIVIRSIFNATSPANEKHIWDDVQVIANAGATWASEVINISTYTAGVTVRAIASRGGTMEAGDSLKFFYSLNGGALTAFTSNGQLLGNFTTPSTASATGIFGNTIQIFIRGVFSFVSPSSEIYRLDMISVYENSFLTNNSPVFGSPPPLYLCAVNTFTINYSATDVDGDVLVYSMYTPYDNAQLPTPYPPPSYSENVATFSPVTFSASYSANSPFNSPSPSVTLNSSTGIMTGVANSLGQYVFGVKCSEYRNGILLSEVVQDFQANVVTCPPFVPSAPTMGMSNSNPVCSGQTLSLTASSTYTGTLTYSWTGPNGFTSTLQNPTIVNVTTAASGTYSAVVNVTGCNSTPGTFSVTVNPRPNAPTLGSNSPVCSGATLSLTATGSATYNWSGPNSFTSTAQNPTIGSVSTAAGGTYTATTTSAPGCVSTSTTTAVTINPTPGAPTPSSNTPVCSGGTLSLTANSTGSTYSWTGPNGFTSSVQNPTISSITTAGNGTYSVTVSTSGCGSLAGSTSVTINQTPAAPTAGSNSPLCIGATLNLTASATGTTYSWTGPNSFTSSVQNPSISGVGTINAGTYSVTTRTNGCTGPAGTVSVTVAPPPATPTAGSNSPVCAGQTLSLTSNTIASATYSWSGPNTFTSSLQNPTIASVTTAASGNYSVFVTVGGCAGSAGTTSVTINPGPVAPTVGSNSPVCSGNTLSLTSSTVTGATYSWTGPNSFTSTSQNPTIPAVTTLANGTYSVNASVTGCSIVSGSTSVTINQTPNAPVAGSNSPVCVGNTLSLTATPTGTTYSWSGPNSFTSTLQNPTLAGMSTANAGTYSVVAISNGCTGNAGTVLVAANPSPTTIIATSNNGPVCTGATLNLTSATVTSGSYSWTGPNAFTSTLQNPSIGSVNTNAAGTYSVSVTVPGCSAGGTGSTTVTINVTPAAPTAGNNSPVCSGNDLSLTASGSGTTYTWTGPNSFTSTNQNPVITPATSVNAGTYSVTTTSAAGCTSASATSAVTINPIPAAPVAGNSGPVCVGVDVSLTATATGVSYNWSGPNSFTSTLQNPVISSAGTINSGTYSVSAISAAGCAGPAGTTTATVNPPPAAPTLGSSSPVCSGQILSLTASTLAGATYSWTGPNSFTSTNQNPTIAAVTTAANGTYSMTATITGCPPLSTVSVAVTINQTPAAPTAGGITPNCVGNNLSLTASSTGATYNWSGPNSFTSTSQNPVISGIGTIDAGTYTVNATSVAGCTSTNSTVAIIINPPPGAPTTSSNSPVCSGSTLNLTAGAITGATSYSWNGPNGFTSSLQNPSIGSISTVSNGTYSVTAFVPGCGTSAAGTASVTINQTPVAPTTSSNSPVCSGSDLSLTASTISGSTYSWTGPASFTSTSQNPTLTFVTSANAGLYSVSATENGCAGPIGTTSVAINAIPTAPTAGSNSPLCTGTTLSLTASTISGAIYLWSGPNSYSSTVQNPSIAGVTTAEAGTYSVSATALGCAGPAGTISVSIAPPPAAPTVGNNSPVCSGNSLSLTASTISGASSYNWSGPNSFSSSVQDPIIGSVTTLATGNYSVSATVGGCTGPIGTTSVTINQTPPAPAVTNNGPLCLGDNLTLNASTITGATYSWTGPNAFTSSTQNNSITSVTSSEAGTYSVAATVNGCTGPIGTTSVLITPPPTAPTLGSNSPVCSGQTLSLTSNTISGATYSWIGPNTFTSSLQNPTIGSVSTLAIGTYSVSAQVGSCISPTSTISITINQTPVAPGASSNSPICSGSDISLSASTVGSAAYNWSGPGSYTSTSQNPIIVGATTANTGLYSVTATENGCTGIAGTTSVTANSIPAPPIAGNNGPLCIGDNLSLTSNIVSGASYSWSGPNSFTSSLQNPTIAGVATSDAGSYSVAITVSGCTGSTSTTSVIVAPPPSTPVAGSNSSICSGNDLSLTANTISGAAYSWSGPNSFTSTLQNPIILSASTNASGTYSVFVMIGSCTSPTGTVAVTISQTPAAAILSSNSPVCSGNNLSLAASAVGSATYAWVGPNSFSSSTQNPVLTGVTTAEAGTYSLTATKNSCPSPVSTITININPPPTAPVAGNNSPICSGTTLSLTASSILGATSYNWAGPNSFSSSLQNPIIGSITTLASGTYSVSANVPGCPVSPEGTVTVSVLPTPAAPTAGNNSPICSGSDISLTASTVGGATYNWSGPGSFTSTSQNPVLISATTANSGLYSVTATENGCTGLAGTTSVTVNAIPSTPVAGNNGPLCVGDNLLLSANTISGATYSWSGPNSFTSTLQNPSIAGVATSDAGTYSVSVTVAGCSGAVGTTSLIVAPPPTTPVAGSNSPICSGYDLSLTASTITGATYVWTGPNSYTSSSQNPVLVNTPTNAAGTYSVYVMIGSCTSPIGSTSTTVNPSPAAPAVSSNSPLCVGDNLSLTASLISGTTYSWTGPNSFTSTTQNPIINNVTTSETGTYSVVTTSIANGCVSATSTQTVSITFPATVNAGTDQTVCANNPAPLNGIITGGAGTGIWSTPNGLGAFSPNTGALNASYTPTINDTLAGNILLILTSTNNGGCTAAKDTVVIQVDPGPVVNAGSDISICSNNYSSVSINGTVQFATGATWTSLGTGAFQLANTILTNTYLPTSADSTNGSVMLVLSSTGNGSCSAVNDTLQIIFTPAPTVNAGANIFICFGDTSAQLNGFVSGGASTGVWSTLGTGTFVPSNTSLNATYLMSQADTASGNVALVLTSTNNGNCLAATDTVNLIMTPAPNVSAGADQTVCANNATVTLGGTVAGGSTTGYWSSNGTGIFLPDSSALNGTYVPSAADTASGTITLMLTSTNGCRPVKDSITITITKAPTVFAGANIGICGSSPVVLNGSVSIATGGQWTTSGNGTFTPDDLTLNATYTPGSNDTAIVTLVLTSTGNGQCLPVSDTVLLLIGKKPVAAFTKSSICVGQLTTFTDASIVISVADTIVSWNWTIAGTSTTTQNASHTYPTAGTDTVTLIVVTNTGCSDTITQIITINPGPTAAFTYTVNCVVDSVLFTNTSTVPTGNIVSWNWNFGDGNSSAVQNPAHSYTTAGTYTVQLTVTSDSGCTSTFSDTVKTCNSVQAGFTATAIICSGQLVNFTDTSMIAGIDSISTWGWNFGDGGADTLQNPSHAYLISGTYTVSLVVVTNSGATDTAQLVILVNPTPQASFTFVSTCALDSVYFSSTSTVSTGNIISWNWNFGDTNTSNLQNPVHYYDSTGTYIVTLVVTSDSGCTSTFIDTIISAKDVVAAFSHITDCQFNVQFTDTSVLASSDTVIIWSWNFGNGNTSNIQNPIQTYTASGTYSVQLVVTTNGGCIDTIISVVTINPLPVADFLPSGATYYKGENINFTDLSANAFSWAWSFGEGGTDNIQNPSYTYQQSGNFVVILVVMNQDGCADTVSYPFKIYPNTVGVPSAFTPNGDGVNDVLHILGGPMQEMDWRIYNEWGNLIFHATDQSMGWDATYKGKLQPASRYVYTLRGTTISGDVIDFKGEISIVR